jgi:hypothetical protein
MDEIARMLRGTRAANYSDGLLAIDRRGAQAVARTAIGAYASAARNLVYEANDDLIDHLEWVSTLDTRTSDICIDRDGLAFTKDGEFIDSDVEWLGFPGEAHWNCRSTSIPVLNRQLVGPPLKRASMDGPVSARLTYKQWLMEQDAARQDEILGPSRGRLLREGGLKVDRFFNNEGRFITLDQLRESDARAFQRIGM